MSDRDEANTNGKLPLHEAQQSVRHKQYIFSIGEIHRQDQVADVSSDLGELAGICSL